MDADRAREVAERDQMWASLRALLPEIARIAVTGPDAGSDRDRQLAMLLARIVGAELDFQAREAIDPA